MSKRLRHAVLAALALALGACDTTPPPPVADLTPPPRRHADAKTTLENHD